MKTLKLLAVMGFVGTSLVACGSPQTPVTDDEAQAIQQDGASTENSAIAEAQPADSNQIELIAPSTDDIAGNAAALVASAVELGNFKTMQVNDNGGVTGKAISSKLETGWQQIDVSGVRVIDGDTVEVLIPGSQSERVRLLGVDAPEFKKNDGPGSQEGGAESTASLQKCVDGRAISIVYKETDRYGRLLGKVFADTTDCNYRQVVMGQAWHYKQYGDGQPNDDFDIYSDAEKLAQLNKQGLWSNPAAIAPWDFR